MVVPSVSTLIIILFAPFHLAVSPGNFLRVKKSFGRANVGRYCGLALISAENSLLVNLGHSFAVLFCSSRPPRLTLLIEIFPCSNST